MRTPITRIERATGTFLFLVFALLTLAVLGAGRRTDLIELFREGYVIHAVSESAYGAAVGSPVKVRDVEVGSVTGVRLVEDPAHPDKPVRITMRLQARAAQFLNDRTVAVIIEPPLGSGMPPFGTSSVLLRSEGTTRLANGAIIRTEAQESMVDTMAKMSRDVSAMRDQMTAAIGEMGTSFSNMRKLTDALVNGKGLAGKMMTDDQLADELAAMVGDARKASADARKLMAEAQKMTKDVPAVVDDARAMSREGQKLMARLNGTLDALPRLIATTERTMALAEELVTTLRTASSHAPELARKVDVSIDEANRLVEAAQKNFILRSTLPDRPSLRTESVVRPPVVLPDGGAP